MVESDPKADVPMEDMEETKDAAELAEIKKNEGNTALKAGNVD